MKSAIGQIHDAVIQIQNLPHDLGYPGRYDEAQMWDRVQTWLDRWGSLDTPARRVLRRPAAEATRAPRPSEAELRGALGDALMLFHRGHREAARPQLERVVEALPVGDDQAELAAAHLDALVTGVGCSCPLRDRVVALLGSEPSLWGNELRAGTDLIVEVGDAVTAVVTESGVRWEDLHFAGSFGDTELLLAVGGELAPTDRERADQALARFLREQHLVGLVTIER